VTSQDWYSDCQLMSQDRYSDVMAERGGDTAQYRTVLYSHCTVLYCSLIVSGGHPV